MYHDDTHALVQSARAGVVRIQDALNWRSVKSMSSRAKTRSGKRALPSLSSVDPLADLAAPAPVHARSTIMSTLPLRAELQTATSSAAAGWEM